MCEFEAGIDYNQLMPGRLIKRPNSRRPQLAKATKKAPARKPYTAADVKLLTEEGGEEVQADQLRSFGYLDRSSLSSTLIACRSHSST